MIIMIIFYLIILLHWTNVQVWGLNKIIKLIKIDSKKHL